jgi:hypothetical protein
VFREGAAPKAVQIIDRSGRGLPPALFSTALRQLAGVRDYRLVSKETNGEYLVKRGRLGNQSQVTLYKDRTDDLLHAFVVVLR